MDSHFFPLFSNKYAHNYPTHCHTHQNGTEMESDDELPQDYYDLTPEHYAKMTVSKVICNRWTSKEKDSCEYLVHYVKAEWVFPH